MATFTSGTEAAWEWRFLRGGSRGLAPLDSW